jgi:hypothetical protein
MGVNAVGCLRVEAPQNAMHALGAVLLGASAQFITKGFVTQSTVTQESIALRGGEKSFEESAQIEAGASGDDGKIFSARDFAENLARLAGIFSGGDFGAGVGAVEEVMRNFGALGSGGLGCADFKLAVHGDRVAVDDFSVKAAGDGEREGRLAAGSGAEHDYDERVAMSQFQRGLHGMYRQ